MATFEFSPSGIREVTGEPSENPRDTSQAAAFAAREALERKIRGSAPAATAVPPMRQAAQAIERKIQAGNGLAYRPKDVIRDARRQRAADRKRIKALRRELRMLEERERELTRLLDAARGRDEKTSNLRALNRASS